MPNGTIAIMYRTIAFDAGPSSDILLLYLWAISFSSYKLDPCHSVPASPSPSSNQDIGKKQAPTTRTAAALAFATATAAFIFAAREMSDCTDRLRRDRQYID